MKFRGLATSYNSGQPLLQRLRIARHATQQGGLVGFQYVITMQNEIKTRTRNSCSGLTVHM